MEVNIKGLKKFDANVFDQIIIVQKYGVFFVDVLGGEIGNEESFKKIEDINVEDNIISIVQRYLDNFRINGISKSRPTVWDGEENIVYGCWGSKQLKIKIFDSKNILGMIMNKYINDRYNYFWNEDIKNLKLESGYNVSRYDKGDDCVEFVMNSNNHGSILYSERDFIESFLYYKFWQIGEEVKIINIYNEYSIDGESVPKEYVIQCGDMKITFPNSFEFSFLFSIVNAYNIELFKIKNNEKKRQLKMEGF